MKSNIQQCCPTCHNSCIVLTGLKGTLALPRLHLHTPILGFLQGEGGALLEDDRKREEKVKTTRATHKCISINSQFVHLKMV